MPTLLDSVFSFFLEEAGEYLTELEAGLLHLEDDPASFPDLSGRLFRAAHTLKGSANLVKFTAVGSIAHEVESILESIDQGRLKLSHAHIDAILFSLDQIRELIRLQSHGKPIPEALQAQAMLRLREAGSAGVGALFLDERPEVQFKPDAVADPPAKGYRQGEPTSVVRVKIEKIEELMGLIGEFTVLKNHLLNRFQMVEKMRKEVDFSRRQLLNEVESFAERYAYTLPNLRPVASHATSGFQELEFDHYDELNLFSRKLREIANDIEAGLGETKKYFSQLNVDVLTMDRTAKQMKEKISEARTVSVGVLFQRFNCTIRDLAREINKPVKICVTGEATAIDRIIYDGLFDPLLHILRNALAHGIESKESREKTGKSPIATIWLSAERQGNTVEITVRDDGQGIVLGKIYQRALALHLVAKGQELPDNELIQMIFRPGFSTTAEVDATSGRGIGMSVVMDRLAALNGTIEVETVRGEGTTFRLRLPLSLVIVNVIRFEVGGQSFVIPSALVDEIVDLEDEQDRKGDSAVLKLKGVERLELRKLFCLSQGETPPRFGILTRSEGGRLLLMVDRLSGQEDTVIKSFGAFVRQTPYFSGSSLAGDGVMSLVVNPTRMKQSQPGSEPPVVELSAQESVTVSSSVLIVDDSLSVRKYAGLLLGAKGFRVLTAVDGREALDILAHETVDSIITDLEMPVMHGYDLLTELKRRDGFKIPVAILSSRAGDQHQAKALSLGATDYLVKPFEDEALIGVVQRHLQLMERNR